MNNVGLVSPKHALKNCSYFCSDHFHFCSKSENVQSRQKWFSTITWSWDIELIRPLSALDKNPLAGLFLGITARTLSCTPVEPLSKRMAQLLEYWSDISPVSSRLSNSSLDFRGASWGHNVLDLKIAISALETECCWLHAIDKPFGSTETSV